MKSNSLIFYAALTVIAFLTFGFGWSWYHKTLASQEAAGWMQALGGVGAIFAAIFTFFEQQAASAKQGKREIVTFLTAVKTEITVYAYASPVGWHRLLLSQADEEIFEPSIEVPLSPTTINASNAGFLSKIDNMELVREILMMYSLVNGFYDGIRLNNTLVATHIQNIEDRLRDVFGAQHNMHALHEAKCINSENHARTASQQLRIGLRTIRTTAANLVVLIDDQIRTLDA